MAKEVSRQVIGDTARFALDLRLLASAPADVKHLGWANLFLWFKGRRVWATGERKLRPVSWTWIDLVEWLSRAWPYILFEENAPFGLVDSDPKKLSMMLPDGVSASEFDSQIWAYQQRHDLSAGLKGIFLPSLWLLPEANLMRLRFGEDDLWVPKAEIAAIFEQFALEVFKLCVADDTGRAALARQRWEQRMPDTERIVYLRSGLSIAQLKSWLPEVSKAKIIGEPASGQETSFMAAARLSASLPEETRRGILSAITALTARETSELDELSRQARHIMAALVDLKHYEQGYRAALWLREELGNPRGPVDPEALLTQWHIEISDLTALHPRLDAVAIWGEDHGPGILINPAGYHTQTYEGRRATLAHEIAHLLVDRETHLPAGEVFGGTTPASLEQRARAFAAEFLLPRQVASDELSKADSLDQAAQNLRQIYQVSYELLGWQILNGPAENLLSPDDRALVDKWCRKEADGA